MNFEVGDIFKIWDDGNLHLGRIKEIHGHPNLIHFDVIRTLKQGSDYNINQREIISSKNNIKIYYGKMKLSEHREAFPEVWI